ncbi:PepSY-associated TM helix domain-containing protein [Costertonia aggregata]|uniref:PepSY domain-containing protein n=1 Tax=Costertonia aggregata TaxID=343403 RepID=A0A7H9AS20_9FLAO|nr:PepSY-associated TM helix domain-containing protein [Costertonia aggregata]QLG46291.1 PepSY domain-containing protein [Costertonia aggregata]
MKLKKKTFFQIHSWIGIRLSILFFIVCFSGTLATLSHEMDWLFIPSIRATPQSELAPRNLMVSNFRDAYPKGEITFWLRTDEPYLCDIIYKMEDGQRSYVFANPYTGKIQGEAQITFQRFFRDLHYFLFVPFQIGHFTVLIFGFLLLISLVTALVFYKKWWRKLFELQTGKGNLVLFRSLHRLIGLWSVPFTLLFSITGIWYFLERANVGDIGKTTNPKPPVIHGFEADKAGIDANNLDYDRAVRVAKKQIPNLVVGDISPKSGKSGSIYLSGKSNVPLVRQRANRVYLNPNTYKVIKTQKATEIGTVMFLNDIADPLHFGYWGGLTTKIIWFVFGLAISLLVLSGIWITLKRKALKRKKSKKKIMGVWRYVNWGFFAIMLLFMYYILIDRYKASITAMVIISIGWFLFLAAAYYIFIYRLNKVVQKIT